MGNLVKSSDGFPDDFADLDGDELAGQVPVGEKDNPSGAEIPSRHLDKLALPYSELTKLLNFKSKKTGRYAWRESFLVALEILLSH